MTATDSKSGEWSGSALTLLSGRVIGFAVSFFIPLILVRVLDQEAFGTYKYVFMVIGTMNVLQFGLAESLYYFVPLYPAEAGRAVANATVSLTVVGCAAMLAFALDPALVSWIGGADLAPYAMALGCYVGLTLIAVPLEIVMISRHEIRAAAWTYALSDLCRAALLVAPGVVTGSVGAVLWGAVVFGLLRTATFAWYAVRRFGREFRWSTPFWREQLAYALPFAVAVLIDTTQINLHQYVVWARYSAEAYAVYAAGCLQVPLVDLLGASIGNVMMVRMAAARESLGVALELWHRAVVKLASILWPFTVALMLTARDLIVVLFTPDYVAAVPIFIVSVLTILFAALPVDSVLRVFACTRFLIVMNVLRLAVIAGGIGWALNAFGLPGAIGITVAGLALAKVAALAWIARTFKVGVRALLPWRQLSRIAALSAGAVVPVLWLKPSMAGWPPLAQGAGIAVAYGSLYILADRAIGTWWSGAPREAIEPAKGSDAVR